MNVGNDQISMKLGNEQLQKMKLQPLPQLVDLSLTRMYFHSFYDCFYRFNLLSMQMIWIAIIFLNGLMISDLVSGLHHFPIAQILQIFFKVGSLVLTVGFAVLVLLLMIPLFIVKTIKSVTHLGILYLIFGILLNLCLIISSLFLFYENNSGITIIALCFSLITLINWIIILTCWIKSAKLKRQKLIKSIIATYELTLK